MLPPDAQLITRAAATQPLATEIDWKTLPNCKAAIDTDNTGTGLSNPIYQTKRNNCIEQFVGAIDYQYGLYKELVFKLTNGAIASTDALSTVLSAGAAGVGGTAARILSGIVAGIGTLKGQLNQDLLYNQTITAIISQMDADRRQQLSVILTQMKSSSDSTALPYTMYAASVDLLGYFEAGTVHHAIVSLQSAAGSKAVSCKAAVTNLKTTGTSAGLAPPEAQSASDVTDQKNKQGAGGTPGGTNSASSAGC